MRFDKKDESEVVSTFRAKCPTCRWWGAPRVQRRFAVSDLEFHRGSDEHAHNLIGHCACAPDQNIQCCMHAQLEKTK